MSIFDTLSNRQTHSCSFKIKCNYNVVDGNKQVAVGVKLHREYESEKQKAN